jgi:hypothetical protein
MTENKTNQLLCYLVNNIIDLTYYTYNNINIKTSTDEKIKYIKEIQNFQFLVDVDFSQSRLLAKKILKFMVYHNNLDKINYFNNLNNVNSQNKNNIQIQNKHLEISNYLNKLNSVKFYDLTNYTILYQTLTNIVYGFDTIYLQAFDIYKYTLVDKYSYDVNESDIKNIISDIDEFIDLIETNLNLNLKTNLAENLASGTYQKYTIAMNLLDNDYIGTINNQLIESMVIYGMPLNKYFDNFTDINVNSISERLIYY